MSMIEPNAFLEQWQGKPQEHVEAALKSLLNQQIDNPFGHLLWAETAENLNCHSLAFREAQLAVKFEPENQDALYLLAQMLSERGNAQRAVIHLETLLKWAPEHVQAKALLTSIHQEMGQALEKEIEVSDDSEELIQPDDYQAFRFLQAFGGREDSYARQWYTREQARGGYTPVHAPLTPREIRNHLLGNETLGVYCLRLDQTVNFMAVDLDINKSSLESARTNPERAAQIREQLKDLTHFLYNHLHSLNLPALIENSGFKGRHLWLIFSEPQPAAVAHVFGQLFLRWMAPHIPTDFHLEFFPKQAEASGKGMGNLIKLPLGIHRRSGRRSVFLNLEGQVIEQPHTWLEQFARIDGDTLFMAIEKLKTMNLPVLFPVKKTEPQIQAPTGPAPMPVGPSWTETDFDSCHPIQHLLKSCPVLRSLRQQVEEHRQLNLEEQLTLIHSLGHLPEGVLAVNYLFSRCGNIAPQNYLQSVLKGNPVSCPKIRKRIPHITARVPCKCDFSFAADTYPSPVLHLRTLPDAPPESVPVKKDTPEILARRYANLERRIQELEQEKAVLAQALRAHLLAQAEPILILPEGQYRLEQRDEVEELRWEPAQGA